MCRYATRNTSGRHYYEDVDEQVRSQVSAAVHTSPVCGPIWIRSTAARDVAKRSRPITSETTAATPRATTKTTIRAPTPATSASVWSHLDQPTTIDDDQEEPAQGDNQTKRLKVAANNVTDRVVDGGTFVITHSLHFAHLHVTHNAHTLTRSCAHTHTHNTPDHTSCCC